MWRVPITSIEQARDFAIRHDFDVTIDALKFDAPKTRIGANSKVTLDDEFIMMKFPYERVIIKAVKQIPAVTWDHKKHAWKAPLSSISNVIE